ncbi:hypothetical protein T440DRAFT_546534 [Plenodomus tracheiphilus IPT5]|uniref:Uncharacterized protein n=1 Tax=Plenodomus tracheiphilus IPT5 TaxID=1408161 RepID=A0A6A7AQF2_9PLEO|nr:hypothetical protein T440DRAFT_546534 [Plenodomus tracheiphilus IPT5]
MPNRIPSYQICDFLAQKALPITLASISLSPFADPNCPIYKNLYANPPANYVYPDIGDGQPDYAIQVVNRPLCSHMVGR